MGKSSKKRSGRNRRRDRRGAGVPDAAAAPPSGDAAAPTPAPSQSDLVARRVRHGDPRVRHAALIALSGTAFAPRPSAGSGSGPGSKSPGGGGGAGGGRASSDPALLRAVSERLLDADVPCAVAAAGCLANYASSPDGFDDEGEGGGIEGGVDVASEVTAPILLQRLGRSIGSLELMTASHRDQLAKESSAPKSQMDKSTEGNGKSRTPFEKTWPKTAEQWSLLSLSCLALAGLIENFPRAVERAGPGALPGLLAVLPLAGGTVRLVRSASENSDGGNGGVGTEAVSEAACHASRALHSLLDENASLISSMPISVPEAASGGTSSAANVTSLSSAASGLGSAVADPDLGDACRLHASGALLSLRGAAVLVAESSGAVLSGEERRLADEVRRLTNGAVLPLVSSVLSPDHGGGGDGPRRLVERMIELSERLAGQRTDEEMESAVVGEINRKKESARSIARRQKAMREEREARQAGGMEVEETKQSSAADITPDERDESMVVEDESGAGPAGTEDDGAGGEGDLRDELDRVVESWRDLVGKHKLCLELVANLCSSGDGDGGDEDGGGEGTGDDGDERMWDSDDEAELLASAAAGGGNDARRTTPSEVATFASLSEQKVPEKVLGLFRRWADFLPSFDGGVPDLVKDDVAEVLEVASTCMSNMLSVDLPTWTDPATDADGTRYQSGPALFYSGLLPVLSAPGPGTGGPPGAARAGAATALLSMLTAREGTRGLVDGAGLGTILGLLDGEAGGGDPADDDGGAGVRTKCAAASMLGLLCSGPHPAEVDAQVCRALLGALRSASSDSGPSASASASDPAGSCAVISEVLNVLMDVYGGDDCHDDVCRAEDVPGHFQRCLPGFRRRIRKCAGADGSAGRDEVEVWNETALNASRFVRYCREK